MVCLCIVLYLYIAGSRVILHLWRLCFFSFITIVHKTPLVNSVIVKLNVIFALLVYTQRCLSGIVGYLLQWVLLVIRELVLRHIVYLSQLVHFTAVVTIFAYLVFSNTPSAVITGIVTIHNIAYWGGLSWETY